MLDTPMMLAKATPPDPTLAKTIDTATLSTLPASHQAQFCLIPTNIERDIANHEERADPETNNMTSITTLADPDSPYNSNHSPHVSAHSSNQDQNGSPILSPIAVTTDSPITDDAIDFYETDTNFEPPATDTFTLPDVEMPGSPTLIDHIPYATNSEWENSPWSQVSYRRKHTSRATDVEGTANNSVPGHDTLTPASRNNFNTLGPRDSTGIPSTRPDYSTPYFVPQPVVLTTALLHYQQPTSAQPTTTQTPTSA